MNSILDVFKRLLFAVLWLGCFSAALWGLYHRDAVLSYLESSPSALKQILGGLFILVLFGGAMYAGWRNLFRESFTCSRCGGSGKVLRINPRYDTKTLETCTACGGRGEVFGLKRRAIAFLALGLGGVVLLLLLNRVLNGALDGVLRIR